MNVPPLCPYCGQFSIQVGGLAIYPHRPDLADKKFYQCQLCDAYVGTHKATGEALGTLANATLRRMRNAAHIAFDGFWETSRERKEEYTWLAEKMGIPVNLCHIAMFDVEQCQQAIQICRERSSQS